MISFAWFRKKSCRSSRSNPRTNSWTNFRLNSCANSKKNVCEISRINSLKNLRWNSWWKTRTNFEGAPGRTSVKTSEGTCGENLERISEILEIIPLVTSKVNPKSHFWKKSQRSFRRNIRVNLGMNFWGRLKTIPLLVRLLNIKFQKKFLQNYYLSHSKR